MWSPQATAVRTPPVEEVVQGEAAEEGGLERGGFADHRVSGRGQHSPVAVTGVRDVAEDLERSLLISRQR